MKRKMTYIVAGVLLFSSASVMAVPIIIDYTGTINSVGASISGFGVNVNDSITGQFVYDTLTPDTNPDANYGNYLALSYSITFQSGFSATSLNTGITVQNDQQNGSATLPADGMTVRANSVSGDSLNGRSVNAFQFGLRRENISGHLWMDDFLPDASDWAGITLADINAPDWHWMQFQLLGDDSIFDSQIRWDIDSFTATSKVPEPTTVLLIGIGLIILGFANRKKKQA